jgi:hypothetical protein
MIIPFTINLCDYSLALTKKCNASSGRCLAPYRGRRLVRHVTGRLSSSSFSILPLWVVSTHQNHLCYRPKHAKDEPLISTQMPRTMSVHMRQAIQVSPITAAAGNSHVVSRVIEGFGSRLRYLLTRASVEHTISADSQRAPCNHL